MAKKVQITLTLDSDHVNAFEGNMSWALRAYFKETKLVETYLKKEKTD